MDKKVVLDRLVKDTKEGKITWYKNGPDEYEVSFNGITFTLYSGGSTAMYLSTAEDSNKVRFISLAGLGPLIDAVELQTSPAFDRLKEWVES